MSDQIKRMVTIGDLAKVLNETIKSDPSMADLVFLTGKDPEGNGFLAYELDDMVAGGTTVVEAGKWRLELSDDGDVNAILLMPTFKIDA